MRDSHNLSAADRRVSGISVNRYPMRPSKVPLSSVLPCKSCFFAVNKERRDNDDHHHNAAGGGKEGKSYEVMHKHLPSFLAIFFPIITPPPPLCPFESHKLAWWGGPRDWGDCGRSSRQARVHKLTISMSRVQKVGLGSVDPVSFAASGTCQNLESALWRNLLSLCDIAAFY